MEFWIGIVLVFAAFLILIVQFAYSNRIRRKRLREKFQKEWGNVPRREYDMEELNRISRYFQYHLKKGGIQGHFIDNITWNDLDMDTVFAYANHTKSSPGEEYLYYLLRTPVTEQSTLDERERLMEFFKTHEKERLELELCFAEIGHTRKFAISDYVDLLLTLEKESNRLHYLAIGTIPLGLVLMTILPAGVGFMIMIGLLAFDIAGYYKRKGEIEPYLTTFGYILKMLEASTTLSNFKTEAVSEYTRRIEDVQKKFQKFRRGSFLVMSGRGATGGLEDMVLDLIRMMTHMDLLKFNSMLEEVKKHVDDIDALVANIGFLDAMISAASFRESLPIHGIPQLEKTEKAFVEVHDVYHPMIAEPVANSISEERSVLLTGSNASGKSTFLKTVAINAIVSQSLNTCIATSYRASFFQIYSSMALTDNLQGNESYYIVEIKSLKRILSHMEEKIPMLCFVDEVLRGTNTLERISASSQILKSLARDNVLCFAATHDLELTQILENDYSNYHFQEEIKDNDVLFNYQLYKGRAVSRNAIKLLQIIGYEKDIIEHAEWTAAHFLETGEWSL